MVSFGPAGIDRIFFGPDETRRVYCGETLVYWRGLYPAEDLRPKDGLYPEEDPI